MVLGALCAGSLSRLCARSWRACSSRRFSWNVARLTERCLVRVAGPDAAPFLQGLITADIYSVEDPRPALYSMVLNVQGRVLFDVIIYKLPASGQGIGGYYIEVDGSLKDQLLQHVKQYRMRKKVDIIDAGLSEQAWVAFNGLAVDRQHSSLTISVPAPVLSFADPRLKELGFRLLAPASLNVADLVADSRSVPVEEYDTLRYELGVGEGPVDHPVGKALPLECNLVYLNGVSFCKGCYIGQELTARSQHTGVIRKRLLPVHFASSEEALRAAFDDEIRDGGGASVGKFRAAVGRRGLALLRHEAALRSSGGAAAAAADSELSLITGRGEHLRITTSRPYWWQAEPVT